MKTWLFLIFISLFNIIFLLPPKQELQVIYHNPLLSYQKRLRLKLGSPFYEYIQFLTSNIPESTTVAIPPETAEWGYYGNFLYMQNYLYPRKITTSLENADYSLLVQSPNNHFFPPGYKPTKLLQQHPILGLVKLETYD